MSFTSPPSTSLNYISPINPNFPSSSSSQSLLKTLTFPSKLTLTLTTPKSSNYNDVAWLDEEMGQIKRLQNGSDVRGVAVEGEAGRKVDLTPPAVEAIAESFGEWVINGLVKEKGRPVEDVRVSLGRDPRISGGSLSVAIFSGLGRAGCMTFDMGLATTPACFMSTVLPPFLYDASIMMTASHLPYTRNGLKFFTKNGGLTSLEVEEICDKAAFKYANRLTKVSTLLRTTPRRVDFMSIYAKHLRDTIKERVNHPQHYDTPLEGFQIIVNAGNGSGGFFTYEVLDKLGADTFGSLNLKPDGMFPNHIPNPEDKVTLPATYTKCVGKSASLPVGFSSGKKLNFYRRISSKLPAKVTFTGGFPKPPGKSAVSCRAVTRTAVLENSADLGIVFDTDVDRSGVVDNEGNPINGDKLIALMAAIVLKEHPDSTIVTDARTSMALTRFITDRGGHHCLYRVGYRNVIDKGVQLNEDGVDAHLMMETSGHGALKENYFLDDGAYMVVKIIIEMVRMKLEGSNEGIGSLIRDLEEPLESIELRMNIVSELQHAKARAIEIIETFKTYIQEGRLEGWELDACGDCWVSDGCLVDSNDTPTPVDAQMYRVKVSDEEKGQYGWLHIRQSIHNPNIAVNMQSTMVNGCLSMARVFFDRFLIASGMNRILDISQIDMYIKSGNID